MTGEAHEGQPAFRAALRKARSSGQEVPESILEMARNHDKAMAACNLAAPETRERLLKVLERMDGIILAFIQELEAPPQEPSGLDELEALKLKALKLKALRMKEANKAGNQ